MKNGNRWLLIQEESIGYWPVEIFKNGGLARGIATHISWGGETAGVRPGFHTSTEMGSGHFASEGWKKAAFIRNLGYFDDAGIIQDANDIFLTVTKPECYSLFIPNKNKYSGVHIYYGGPGYNDKCKH
ncbi:hypothetical protein LINGRAHAP2_LOCUS22409 [Linum grandiflorum]